MTAAFKGKLNREKTKMVGMVEFFRDYARKEAAVQAAIAAAQEADRAMKETMKRKPTEKQLAKIAELKGIGWDAREWVKKWQLYYQKGTPYGRYELKKDGDGCFRAYLKGEQVSLGIPSYLLEKEDEVKKALDTRDRAEKEAVPLMKKLGLYDLCYESLGCKRSAVYDRTPHYFRDEEKLTLQQLKDKSPDTSKWEIRIEHSMASLDQEQRAYESRTECEWGYDRGDHVEIRTPAGLLEWGVLPR